MTFDCVIVRYAELTLKGTNRPFFESHLRRHLSARLKGKARIVIEHSRTILWPENGGDVRELAEKARTTFGVAYVAPALFFPFSGSSVEDAQKALFEISTRTSSFLAGHGSFKVEARRADKQFPMDSMAINRLLGEFLAKESGVLVDVVRPARTVFVEANKENILVTFEKLQGFGGLPAGTAGKVAVLLSSGFDSPVAAFLLARRGCDTVLIHFHSYPQTSRASIENVKDLARVLAGFVGNVTLYTVPILDIQKEIAIKAPADHMVLLYRRVMMRLAARIAKKEGALALVTGESVGQVASQTLENIAVTDAAARIPVLRPLCGTNKEEIIALARVIGTYEYSARPAEDCCTLFIPRHPVTKGDPGAVGSMEKKITGLSALERAALGGAERFSIGPSA